MSKDSLGIKAIITGDNGIEEQDAKKIVEAINKMMPYEMWMVETKGGLGTALKKVEKSEDGLELLQDGSSFNDAQKIILRGAATKMVENAKTGIELTNGALEAGQKSFVENMSITLTKELRSASPQTLSEKVGEDLADYFKIIKENGGKIDAKKKDELKAEVIKILSPMARGNQKELDAIAKAAGAIVREGLEEKLSFGQYFTKLFSRSSKGKLGEHTDLKSIVSSMKHSLEGQSSVRGSAIPYNVEMNKNRNLVASRQ